MSEQKAHRPTPRKLREARKEGKVLRAPMFSQSFSMVMLVLVLLALVRYLWFKNRILLEYSLEDAVNRPLEALGTAFMGVLLLSGIPLVISALTGVAVQGLVAGFVFEWRVLVPRASRFGQGLKQIGRGLKQSWETLLKMLVFGTLTYWILGKHLVGFSNRLSLSTDHALETMSSDILLVTGKLVACFMVLSCGELFLRYREFYRDLSMSDQDMKQEHRSEEGDPHLQSARKALHREVLSQEIVERVKKARVILVQRKSSAENVSKAPTGNY